MNRLDTEVTAVYLINKETPEILTCLVSDLAASLPNRAGFHVEAEAQVRFVQRRVEGIQRLA